NSTLDRNLVGESAAAVLAKSARPQLLPLDQVATDFIDFLHVTAMAGRHRLVDGGLLVFVSLDVCIHDFLQPRLTNSAEGSTSTHSNCPSGDIRPRRGGVGVHHLSSSVPSMIGASIPTTR